MTTDQVLALPALVPVWPSGAAACGGLSRPSAYKLARAGEFPVEVVPIQGRYFCRRSDLLAFLGLDGIAVTQHDAPAQ
ncbi:helix-turn-helix domain-containing protein [Kitasatospora sp. NBC_00458]|uniref:helix-turn-helix domain-containing protein n=1 Tax=Kitasatospora sp. NBC_00458 TaxID=2903568 RepID=UPI002E17BAB4